MHKVSPLIIFVIVAFTGLIQATALEYISFLGIKPDLLLMLVIFFSLSFSAGQSSRAALAAGAIKDITSSSVFGGYTVSFFLIAVFLNFHRNKFFKDKATTQAPVAFISYIAMSALVIFINLISAKAQVSYYPFLKITLKGAAYTAMVAPLAFFFLSKVLRVKLAPSL